MTFLETLRLLINGKDDLLIRDYLQDHAAAIADLVEAADQWVSANRSKPMGINAIIMMDALAALEKDNHG